jgi:hypothetical protein
MRFLLLLLLVPFPAFAKDINIYVSYVIKQERIRPDPKIVHPQISQHFVLHENGKVDEAFHTGGKFPVDHQSSSKLGRELKVSDDRTVKRSWRVGAQARELTVTTIGTECVATLTIKNGLGEFKSFSTDLNTVASYRNSEVESTKCKIE